MFEHEFGAQFQSQNNIHGFLYMVDWQYSRSKDSVQDLDRVLESIPSADTYLSYFQSTMAMFIRPHILK